MLKAKNMKSLKGNKVVNQIEIMDTENNIVSFASYESPIIELDLNKKKITVYPDYDYSRTTSQYLHRFLQEKGFDKISNKKSLEKAIETGTTIIDNCEYTVEYVA